MRRWFKGAAKAVPVTLVLLAAWAPEHHAGGEWRADGGCRCTLVAPNEVVCLAGGDRLIDLRWTGAFAEGVELFALGEGGIVTEFKGAALEDGRLFLAWAQRGGGPGRLRLLTRKASGAVDTADLRTFEAGELPHRLLVFVSGDGALRAFYVLCRTRSRPGKPVERWEEIETLLWKEGDRPEVRSLVSGEGRILEALAAGISCDGGLHILWAERKAPDAREVRVMGASYSPEALPDGKALELIAWRTSRREAPVQVEGLTFLSEEEGAIVRIRRGGERHLYRKTPDGRDPEYLVLGDRDRWDGYDEASGLHRILEEAYDAATGGYYTRVRWVRGSCSEEFVLPRKTRPLNQPDGACYVFLEEGEEGYRLGRHCAFECLGQGPGREIPKPEGKEVPRKTSGGT